MKSTPHIHSYWFFFDFFFPEAPSDFFLGTLGPFIYVCTKKFTKRERNAMSITCEIRMRDRGVLQWPLHCQSHSAIAWVQGRPLYAYTENMPMIEQMITNCTIWQVVRYLNKTVQLQESFKNRRYKKEFWVLSATQQKYLLLPPGIPRSLDRFPCKEVVHEHMDGSVQHSSNPACLKLSLQPRTSSEGHYSMMKHM